MPVAEFELIQRYFSRQDKNDQDLILGIGDDAAMISKDSTTDYVIAVDTLNKGVHFPVNTSAQDIAYKALAVNLSDMAAMGASPRFVTLSLSLDDNNEQWLADFSQGLMQTLDEYGVSLIGGDTTQGPLSISVQIIGEVDKGKALLRSGAQVGDKVYVSGTIGDAALGLDLLLNNKLDPGNSDHQYLRNRLNRPTPRVALGKQLAGIAHSCIDISDGLLADLGHIMERSHCGARVYIDQLPVSDSYKLTTDDLSFALSGGDDYELCFSVAAENEQKLQTLSRELGISLTCIGEIIADKELQSIDARGEQVEIHQQGYQHFGAEE
jgi:thiamine-monophosphate kinase